MRPRAAPAAARGGDPQGHRRPLGERYNVRIRTKLRAFSKPHAAILREVGIGRHNLIVLGVDRRPGETLFFGDTAANLLEKANASILFVTGGTGHAGGNR